MLNKMLTQLGLLAVSLTISACATTQTAPEEPLTSEEEVRVTLTGSLGNQLVVEDAVIDHSKAVLTAQVHLRNKHNQRVKIRYRFIWFDAAGMQVGVSEGTQNHLNVQAFDSLYLREQAPFPAATDFKLLVHRR